MKKIKDKAPVVKKREGLGVRQKEIDEIFGSGIGEGFEIDTENIKSWKAQFHTLAKDSGKVFTFKKITDNKYKVWRTK